MLALFVFFAPYKLSKAAEAAFGSLVSRTRLILFAHMYED